MSIQVIDKSSGRYSVLRSFGIGRTEAELQHLEALARQYIAEKTGQSGTLFPEDGDMLTEEFVFTLSNSSLQVIGPELMFGRGVCFCPFSTCNNITSKKLTAYFIRTRM
ncbi:MAG: hypothetical protein LBS42_07570 [Tannerella sp.]|nr:hypothetical protein [Tannerella sp.]